LPSERPPLTSGPSHAVFPEIPALRTHAKKTRHDPRSVPRRASAPAGLRRVFSGSDQPESTRFQGLVPARRKPPRISLARLTLRAIQPTRMRRWRVDPRRQVGYPAAHPDLSLRFGAARSSRAGLDLAASARRPGKVSKARASQTARCHSPCALSGRARPQDQSHLTMM
jgi:hypothetical protein